MNLNKFKDNCAYQVIFYLIVFQFQAAFWNWNLN